MNVTLLAPTYSVVAQLPAGVATCHSTARLSHPENPFPIIPKKDPNYEKRMGVTIVDEIFLLSRASFAEWDEINRKRTGKDQIFGGMHMIIISDLLQLQMGDDGQQISEAHLLDKFEFYELHDIRRQDRGPIFRDFLKRERTADLNPSMLKFINDRLTPRGVGYLTGTVDKFLEIHDDHTHLLTSTHKRRRAFNDAIIAQKFQKNGSSP
ncbi:hypothetical protein B9Z55_012850 [Caenorhabditis nigoni]|uniref:ATP-dependent DNA helicase n=3 Tax=Caenorhabditis nigoni TaxID=1611254 RepID=A0A2G5TZ44_9PELO|nr:hypothetical protein B9Z55_012850 [Caenorhabditis nigoni]